MLTDKEIKALKPAPRLYRKADERGLVLEVTPTGSKLWRFRFKLGGKWSMASLGQYPAVSLAEARRKRDEAAKLAGKGINPVHARQAQQADTLRSLMEDFLRARSETVTPRTTRLHRALLDKHIFPVLGSRPHAEITPRDILSLLKRIEGESPTSARKCQQLMGAAFRFGVVNLRCEGDPVASVRGALAPRAVQHHPIVEGPGIREFFASLDAYGASPIVRAAIDLLWLTTLRTVELVGLRWDEIDFDKAVCVIPAERMKKRRDHAIPLVGDAVAILRTLEPLTRRAGWVFPHRVDFSKCMNVSTLRAAWARMGIKDFSPHGIRGSFSTWAHDAGYRSEVIEFQLNHIDRNVTRASYNRSQYLGDRRVLLEAWAKHLRNIRQLDIK